MKKLLPETLLEENPTIRIADRIHEIPKNLYFLLKRLARTNSTANTIANIIGFDIEIGFDEQCRSRLNHDGASQLKTYEGILDGKEDIKRLKNTIEQAIIQYQHIVISYTNHTEIVAGDYLEYIRKLAGNRNTLAERLGEHLFFSGQVKCGEVKIGKKSLTRLTNFISMMKDIQSNHYLFDPIKKSIT